MTTTIRTARRTRPGRRLARMLLLTVVVAWCLVPFAWLVSTSLKQGTRALQSPNILQGPFGLGNYAEVLAEGFSYNLRNSFIVAATTTVLCIVIGVLAGYALARLDVRRRMLVLTGILAVSLFPPVSLVPPLYTIWRELGLLDTYPGLYLPYTAFEVPLVIFLLTTFFSAIPAELEEAALVDGCTRFQAFLRVVLPLATPGIFAAAIITFVGAWNEYLLASTFAPRSLAAQTVPVAVAALSGDVQFEPPIGTITAACVIVTVPMVLLALLFQKRIISGLTSGAMKG
jgi:multiple sugar transport system permease protein